MKCPKCSLVTFDHLAKCPKCGKSFRLQRRLTRVRTAPSRAIQLPGSQEPAWPEPRPVAVEGTSAPSATAVPESTTTPQQEPVSTASAPAPTVLATELPLRGQPQPDSRPQQARGSIFAADLAPAPDEKPVPLAEIEQQPTEPEAIDPQTADAARLKQRMIHASQARRKQGPDIVSETTDPVLPDWYDPSSVEEECDEATVTASPGKR